MFCIGDPWQISVLLLSPHSQLTMAFIIVLFVAIFMTYKISKAYLKPSYGTRELLDILRLSPKDFDPFVRDSRFGNVAPVAADYESVFGRKQDNFLNVKLPSQIELFIFCASVLVGRSVGRHTDKVSLQQLQEHLRFLCAHTHFNLHREQSDLCESKFTRKLLCWGWMEVAGGK